MYRAAAAAGQCAADSLLFLIIGEVAAPVHTSAAARRIRPTGEREAASATRRELGGAGNIQNRRVFGVATWFQRPEVCFEESAPSSGEQLSHGERRCHAEPAALSREAR